MTNPVAPVEGHYALLRNGQVCGPMKKGTTRWYAPTTSDHWNFDGTVIGYGKLYPELDIIATILPANMQAAASGELERLRAALKAHEVQWNRLQDAIDGMEKTMEAHGIHFFKWQPMTFDETLQGDAP